ncbi:hypothetical protein [Modestobacter sp. SYSU DS0511]
MNPLYEELFHARQSELLRDARLHRLARSAKARSPRRRRIH